jgi:RimJ/RimL family protein N-acetyltransferase
VLPGAVPRPGPELGRGATVSLAKMGAMRALERDWPVYGLRVRTGPLELRLPDDDDLAALVTVVRAGVHDPAVMPFNVAWSDAEPDQRARSMLQYHWRCRAEWTPTAWALELVVVRDGEVVGVQSVHAQDFAVRRDVETGSFLGIAHQRQGTGTLMRQAVLHLAFAGLGARSARSGAFVDNDSSWGVSAKLGYEPDGSAVASPRGEPVEVRRLLLTRERWEASSRPEVDIVGLDACRDLFGIA